MCWTCHSCGSARWRSRGRRSSASCAVVNAGRQARSVSLCSVRSRSPPRYSFSSFRSPCGSRASPPRRRSYSGTVRPASLLWRCSSWSSSAPCCSFSPRGWSARCVRSRACATRGRGAPVQAREPCLLWSLDRGPFERWVRDRYEMAARIRSSAEERAQLAALPFFRGLDALELDRIAARLVTRRVPAGQVVFSEGDAGDRYYLIREGLAEVRIAGEVVRQLARGDGFGDLALLFGHPRTATVTALTDLVLAGLGREDFQRLVRSSGEKVGEFRARTAHYVGAGLGSATRGV